MQSCGIWLVYSAYSIAAANTESSVFFDTVTIVGLALRGLRGASERARAAAPALLRAARSMTGAIAAPRPSASARR